MPKRRIDPTTGKPQLTDREQRLTDEYIKNGGNGSQAAAAAGYGGARPDQSAYQVLHRAEVQRHIRERIAESRVSADEIIGTLASFMRGKLGAFFDESGAFSIQLAKEKGIDHLLKSVSGTTRQIEATGNRPAQVVHTYRVQLHSPIQAATALARISGINSKTLSRPATLGPQASLPTSVAQLNPDPIPTPDSSPNVPTFQRANVPTPPEFDRKYARINRHFQIGHITASSTSFTRS